MNSERSESPSRILLRTERRQRQIKSRNVYKSLSRRIVQGLAVVAVFVGFLVLGRIPYFYIRSWWVGTQLVHKALNASTKSQHHDSIHKAAWPSSVLSVIEIPKLGVNAPVIQGTQMQQLNVAVGHLPTSVMPGQPGTSILAGHNATWFRHINRLKPGNLITIIDRQRMLQFRVTHAAVVHVGTPVLNSHGPSIVLEACYPLNALYLTPYRYLVWANLVSSQLTVTTQLHIPTNIHYVPEGIPQPVQAQGLTLKTNYLPMGTLTIQGHPSEVWRQSNAPLNAADATTTLFLAILHVARANNPTWWHELAPEIPYTTLMPLVNSQISHFLSLTNEYETVTGSALSETELKVSVQLIHDGVISNYQIEMGTRVHENKVRISRLRLVVTN
ncbi:class D sortase [Sulfobacillus thermosulfidooxidans]|uniref:class D sortase n=1 Tax=Sulfobacillus thermosulfidooxidans TaxID=28034 RepID=UPI000424109C|nr:class D sortase [Sulfobacillus thermosulfidooxidans]